MKKICASIVALLTLTLLAQAQDQPDPNDIITRMKTDLDLQEDQVTNVTPIIEKYAVAFHDLQKSIEDGTMNQSSLESQRQGIEDEETQELSPYLKPDQLASWRQMQTQLYDQKGDSASTDGGAGADEYSNLPR